MSLAAVPIAPLPEQGDYSLHFISLTKTKMETKMPKLTPSRVFGALIIICLIIMMIPLLVSGQTVEDWQKIWAEKDQQHKELEELRGSIESNIHQLTQQIEDANRQHSIVTKQIEVVVDEKLYIEDMASRTRSGEIGEAVKKNSEVPLLPILKQAQKFSKESR